MADQKNRGGKKKGTGKEGEAHEQQGVRAPEGGKGDTKPRPDEDQQGGPRPTSGEPPEKK